ncbi:MAG: hypothetical protein J5494_02320 [Candidatus Methanomethylophilaceae archaeon]|nr:hypothetical protein [Candidatus Methanomethylophilaceae archaeon]
MKKQLLAACGLLIALAAVSCGSEPAQEPSGTPASDGSGSSNEETPSQPVYDIPEPELPERDYGGAAFTFYAAEPEEKDETVLFYEKDFLVSEGLTAEPVNDAVFNRNLKVEQKFNLKVKVLETDAKVDTLILSGDTTIDMVAGDSVWFGDNMSSGIFLNFMDLPYVNLTAEYWSPLCVEGTRLDDKIYMMPSDITMLPLASVGYLYFNKRILNENDLENPYDMVYNNTWTIDNFLAMVRKISQDLNGDGVMDAEDLYGYLPITGFRMGCYLQFFYGSGMKFTAEDEESGRVIAVDGDKAQELIDKLREVLEDHTICLDNVYIRDKFGDELIFRNMFLEGHALFTESNMAGMDQFREMEDDFGIVPNPKYDSSQESYFHRVSPHVSMFTIPATAQDLDKTGAVMEYMSWLSHYTVLPAYYEITVKQKRVRDEDAVAMLDIIRKTMVFEFGDVYDSYIPNYLSNSYDDGSYSRRFAASLKILNKRLAAYVRMIRALD